LSELLGYMYISYLTCLVTSLRLAVGQIDWCKLFTAVGNS